MQLHKASPSTFQTSTVCFLKANPYYTKTHCFENWSWAARRRSNKLTLQHRHLRRRSILVSLIFRVLNLLNIGCFKTVSLKHRSVVGIVCLWKSSGQVTKLWFCPGAGTFLPRPSLLCDINDATFQFNGSLVLTNSSFAFQRDWHTWHPNLPV